MWQHLTVLVLVPMMATAVVAAALVSDQLRDGETARRAAQMVQLVIALDGVRQAIDAETIPTVALDIADYPGAAAAAGLSEAQRAQESAALPAQLGALRRATESAIADWEAHTTSLAAGEAPTVMLSAPVLRERLRTARSASDQHSVQPAVIARLFLSVSDAVGLDQQNLSAQIAAGGLSTASIHAVQDMDQVVRLGQLAGQQVVLLMVSQLSTQDGDGELVDRWLQRWGAYSELSQRSDALSQVTTRAAWRDAMRAAPVRNLDAALTVSARQEQDGAARTGDVLVLMRAVDARETFIAGLLQQVSAAVVASASDDADRAQRDALTTAGAAIALLVGSLTAAGAQARRLARSVRDLAHSARRITSGELIEVSASGPQELRTAAAALVVAVRALHQVQDLAQAITRGGVAHAHSARALPGPLGEVVRASLEQITTAMAARDELQADLSHQAVHDGLTGLVNREQLLRTLDGALRSAQESSRVTGLLFIDLDGFKKVNDTHGHAAGDHVLQVMARRFAACLRATDVLARFGGDEFVVVIEDVQDEEHLVALAARLLRVAGDAVPAAGGRRPHGMRAADVQLGASVGVALCRSGALDPDALIAEADAAVYRAKASGKGCVSVFDDAMRAELAARTLMEHELRTALTAGELTLAYQPVVDAVTLDVIGHEALARWQHPELGPVRPDVFIAVAEASTLVCDLGRWALREASAQLVSWRRDGLLDTTIAVNLSARHLLETTVVDDVAAALSCSDLPPGALIIEITETVLVDSAAAVEHLHQLRALGVRVAIDDFGTGYTSIGQLAHTPADILKIDRSFVASLEPAHHQLATMITHAAHAFGMTVVAEGVEEVDQLTRLRGDGADHLQGYLFARPLPASEVLGAAQRASSAGITTPQSSLHDPADECSAAG